MFTVPHNQSAALKNLAEDLAMITRIENTLGVRMQSRGERRARPDFSKLAEYLPNLVI